MKIKNLHIDSYRHLENLHFDFTYPEGDKKGQPLEKICIIGQSATGKTSILELIRDNIYKIDSARMLATIEYLDSNPLNLKGQIEYIIENESLIIEENSIIKNGRPLFKMINSGAPSGGAVRDLIEKGLRLIYLSSEIISKEILAIFNKNPVNLVTEYSIEKYSKFQYSPSNANYTFEFGQNVNPETWVALLSKILDYRKRFTQMASELINKGAIGDLNKLNKQYADWSQTNPNPLKEFAAFFNVLLNKLNLEIDLVNTEFTVPVKSKIKDEVIPISSLSTGTKGLLLSMFPLYELDTNDAIILMDEPERSLFPDIQIEIIDTYKKLAPNAQIIVATHSPFIAAAFEPEERFILYFNEEGKVAVRRGESPIGDDPNDMLTNDFNVSYYNEFGKAAYKRYLDLKTQARDEKEPKKKKELIVKMAALGDKYNF